MLDLVIKNARLIDGTGRPSTMGALGVSGRRIATITEDQGLTATRVIDAEGRVLAPGFIDPHTHYDAQICWDRMLTSSPWHGVTTVLMGNCGVGLAPARPGSREALLRDLENVEGMPYEVMQSGVPWSWETHGEYLDYIEKGGTSINVAALVSLTALRHYVMGEASIERGATADELAGLVRALRETMNGGAFGFSTDLLPHHVGYKGRPLACANANEAELRAMSGVLKELGRGTISLSIASMRMGTAPISDEDVALLRLLVEESGRTITFLPLLSKAGEVDFPKHTLAKLGSLVERAVPQITPRPMVFLVNLKKPFRFAWYDSWKAALNGTPAEQLALYASPEWRRSALAEMATHARKIPWENFRVLSAGKPSLRVHHGTSIKDIAAAQGKTPLETMLDIAVEDGLDTIFQVETANTDPKCVEWLVKNPQLMIGLSDAGAHVDQLCDVGYATAVLQTWVRERQAISLEEAVRRLTTMPGAVIGATNRGKLEVGYHADLVLFDPDTVGCEPPTMINDLPLGAPRLIAKATGIAGTFVGGVEVVHDGELTGEMGGRVLRSGNPEG